MTARAEAASFTGRTAWARSLALPVRDFLNTESGSAVVLLAATLVALTWANVDAHSYTTLWAKTLSIRVGGAGVAESLRGWINDGLMVFFFLVVGLEARREFDMGELRQRRRGDCNVDRHGIRTRAAGARRQGLPKTPHVHPDPRRLRRHRSAPRDRLRVCERRLVHRPRNRRRTVRRLDRTALLRRPECTAHDRDRRGDLGRAARIRDPSHHRRSRPRPRSQRVPSRPNRPRAGDGARARVPRAADRGARSFDTARP